MLKKMIFLAAFFCLFTLGSSGATSFSGSVNLMSRKFHSNVSVAGALSAESCTFEGLSVEGSASISQSQMKSLNVAGALSLDQSQVMGELSTSGSADLTSVRVRGKTVIEGALSATRGTFMTFLTISGGAHLTEFKLNGPTTIAGGAVFSDVKASQVPLVIDGPVHSTGSSLSDISIAGEKSVLRGGVVRNIRVRKNQNTGIGHTVAHFFSSLFSVDKNGAEQQILILEDAIQVKGQISFEGKNGVVYTDAPHLLEGKVYGGEIRSL